MSEIPPYLGSHSPEHAITDVQLVGYLLKIISELEKEVKIPITRATKYMVNFLHDFRDFAYRTDMIFKPNPHGLVCAFSGDAVRNISERDCYLKDLSTMAENYNWWRYIENENVLKPLTDLKNADKELFSELFFDECKSLLKIYHNLSTEELNILASHRNEKDDNDCLEFEFRYWETNFSDIITKLEEIMETKFGFELSGKEYNELKEEITESDKKMYIACHEICKKALYSKKGINDVKCRLEKLREEKVEYKNGPPKIFINNIIKSIESKSDPRIVTREKINRVYLMPFYLLLTSTLQNINIRDKPLIERDWFRNPKNNEKEKRYSAYFHVINEVWKKYNAAEKLEKPIYYLKNIQNLQESKIRITKGECDQFIESLQQSNLGEIITFFKELHSKIKEIGDNRSLLKEFSTEDKDAIEEGTKGAEGDV